MNQQTPSREIRRRLMLSIHQDGLLDILAGLIIATFGTIPLLDASGMNPGVRSVIFLSCYLLEVVVILWLKQVITLPRTGLVKLTRKTASKLAVTLLIINIILFLVFAGSYLFKIRPWDLFGSYRLSIMLGLAFMVPLTAAGLLLNAYRFTLYGLLVLAVYMAGEYLYFKEVLGDHGIPAASFISGGTIVLTGGIYLYRFIHTYSAA
ncbi:MAG: hypothetical protein ACWGNV_15375 [Bacteroidales bacterium]